MQLEVKMWLLLVFGATIICNIEARRVRVRPLPDPEQEEETIQYYAAAEPREAEAQGVVYVSAADQYNGLYGQPTAASRHSQDNYIPSGRITASQIKAARLKETPKAPPVQTIRNYNKVNDDGSFTFGYEAADGSFKEETRGTDCVVRGKYGYVDPDGNKREFTYVSGNPCDPNAPKEEELPEEESNEPENVPANYPTRPIRPLRPVTPSPKPVTLFQNNYQQGEDVQPEPEQLLKPHRFQQDNNLISPSPSPLSAVTIHPKTTPRIVTTKPIPSSTAAPASGGQVYSSELVFDPSTGLYNTQLYQSLPQTEGDFSLSHRIQPYVHQPQPQVVNFQQLQQQSPLYRTIRPQASQAVYQQQQAELQFQNSAQLYAQQQQQQKVRAQQARTQPKVQPQAAQPQQHQYYYIQPSGLQHPHQLVGGGQIDAFLRGHNVGF